MSGQPRDGAIFVGGLPRSGTSLMRDILGSHPDVATTPAAPGGRARIGRCLTEEGAWHLLRSLQLWSPIARALGRLPRERG